MEEESRERRSSGRPPGPPPGPGGPPPPGGPGGGEKAKNFKGSIKNLLHYMGFYKFAIIVVAIFAIGSTIFTVIGPKILGNATTELYNGIIGKLTGTGEVEFMQIAIILLTLIGLYILSALFSFIQGWLMTGISQKMSLKLRRDISEKINRMPLAYFESNTVGDVLSRITNDVDTLGMSLNQSITQMITSVCTLVGITVMMFTISPLMALITLIILPVSAVLVTLIVRVSQKYFRAQQKYLGEIDGQIEEAFSGYNVVKAFNREDAELEEFGETNDILYESAWKSQFLSGIMQPLMTFVGNLGYVAVAISGAMLAARGVIAIGDIVAFIQYVKQFSQPIGQLSQVSNMLQSMAAAAERIFEFLAEDEEDQGAAVSDPPASAAGQAAADSAHLKRGETPASDAEHAAAVSEYLKRGEMPAPVTGQVNFDHVRFGYNPAHPVIKDFNCEIRSGQMVAIVGPTGAGKTTMVKLLMRFYDVDSGMISLDGQDIRSYGRSELRSNFGMVLQDTWLFKGTIMENIRYGRLDATDAEVIAAAKAARADRFIRTLPGGYNMELNEEASNVSQGQKQLLTIARALLADNPILILDEATSSVDTRTEQLIQDAMAELMKGRTSFVIAHRLSTIRDADLILVMRDGDIVEQGTHQSLLAQDGFYASLYNSQFEDIG